MRSLWITHVTRDKSGNVGFKAESGGEAVNAEEQGSLGKLGLGLSVQTSVPGDDEGRRSHAVVTLGPVQAEAPAHLMYLFSGQSPLTLCCGSTGFLVVPRTQLFVASRPLHSGVPLLEILSSLLFAWLALLPQHSPEIELPQ